MNEELTDFIIRELTRHHDRKEIVRNVCERGGLAWKDAERFVHLVEAKHGRTIAKRQTPLLLFISIGTLMLGMGLLAMNMQSLFALFQTDVIGQVLSARGSYYQLLGLITGLGMTVGGLIGLWKAMGTIFPE
jgi:hypothetical protein